jgi:hypothetical protein
VKVTAGVVSYYIGLHGFPVSNNHNDVIETAKKLVPEGTNQKLFRRVKKGKEYGGFYTVRITVTGKVMEEMKKKMNNTTVFADMSVGDVAEIVQWVSTNYKAVIHPSAATTPVVSIAELLLARTKADEARKQDQRNKHKEKVHNQIRKNKNPKDNPTMGDYVNSLFYDVLNEMEEDEEDTKDEEPDTEDPPKDPLKPHKGSLKKKVVAKKTPTHARNPRVKTRSQSGVTGVIPRNGNVRNKKVKNALTHTPPTTPSSSPSKIPRRVDHDRDKMSESDPDEDRDSDNEVVMGTQEGESEKENGTRETHVADEEKEKKKKEKEKERQAGKKKRWKAKATKDKAHKKLQFGNQTGVGKGSGEVNSNNGKKGSEDSDNGNVSAIIPNTQTTTNTTTSTTTSANTVNNTVRAQGGKDKGEKKEEEKMEEQKKEQVVNQKQAKVSND